ncbi:hypothetical protein MPER_13240 [Moniliophthora perniciosa FA553]|nr:hypothetical protein MPER_13240 [Moniliophthora perniciosa FA553]
MPRQRPPSPVSPTPPARLRSPDLDIVPRIRFDDDENEGIELISPKKRPANNGRRAKGTRKKRKTMVNTTVDTDAASLFSDVAVSSSSAIAAEVDFGGEGTVRPPQNLDVRAGDAGQPEELVNDSNGEEDNEFERYIRAVEAGCAGFRHVSHCIYAVQGWNQKREQPMVRLDATHHEEMGVLM